LLEARNLVTFRVARNQSASDFYAHRPRRWRKTQQSGQVRIGQVRDEVHFNAIVGHRLKGTMAAGLRENIKCEAVPAHRANWDQYHIPSTTVQRDNALYQTKLVFTKPQGRGRVPPGLEVPIGISRLQTEEDVSSCHGLHGH